MDLSQEVQAAFDQWMTEQRLEDLKLIRFELVSVCLIQAIAWAEKRDVTCNIPIGLWLSVSCALMMADSLLKMARARQVDWFVRDRVRPATRIRRLKIFAGVEAVEEALALAWILYGEIIFYSEENTCALETKHNSFSYLLMFLLLTFGLILVFKWAVRLLEVMLLLGRGIR